MPIVFINLCKASWKEKSLTARSIKAPNQILTIHGNIKIDQWEGKDGTPRAQLRVHAKNIDFLNIGKKPATDNNVPDAPTDTPKEKKDDLPFWTMKGDRC